LDHMQAVDNRVEVLSKVLRDMGADCPGQRLPELKPEDFAEVGEERPLKKTSPEEF